MQQIGMEWFFRLVMEPRRLWRRYLLGNAEFIGIVLRQWLHARRAARSGEAVGTHPIPTGDGD
jgi:N-acetylglucosaminyldiphosphoundecaprenol N-acetyl-beta-D-mannosaminyltransferase